MKQLIFYFVFSMSLISAYGQTQLEMNEQAAKDFKKADKELNAVFQQIIKANRSDTVFIKNLKKAQNLWIQLRDAELDAKFPEEPGKFYGTVAPMCWSMYKTDLTKERIKKLRVWLTGVKEGDVCAGSVKTI